MKPFLTILFSLIFTVLSSHGSAEYRLYKKGKPHQDYAEILFKIKAGDVIRFSDNTEFKVEKRLACGGVSCVLSVSEIGGNHFFILKIAKDIGVYHHNGQVYSFRDSIDELRNGLVQLERFHIPHAYHFKKLYLKGEYIALEKIDFSITLDEYLKNYESKPRSEMDRQLIKFAKSLYAFNYVGDFRSEQVVWDGKAWQLIDWSDSHSLASDLFDAHPFENLKMEFSKSLYKQVHLGILKQRVKVHTGKSLPNWVLVNPSLSKWCVNLLTK